MNEIIEIYTQNFLSLLFFASLFIISGFYLASKGGAMDWLKTVAVKQGIKPHITKEGVEYYRIIGLFSIIGGIIWLLLPFIVYLKNHLF